MILKGILLKHFLDKFIEIAMFLQKKKLALNLI